MKLHKRNKQWLVWALRQMANTTAVGERIIHEDEATGFRLIIDTRSGICDAVSHRVGGPAMLSAFDAAIEKWPGYSGETIYPVPHPAMDPADAFYGNTNLWDDDEYGDSRRELAAFAADWIEENIDEG